MNTLSYDETMNVSLISSLTTQTKPRVENSCNISSKSPYFAIINNSNKENDRFNSKEKQQNQQSKKNKFKNKSPYFAVIKSDDIGNGPSNTFRDFFHIDRKTPKWIAIPNHDDDTNANKKNYSEVNTTIDIAMSTFNKNNQKKPEDIFNDSDNYFVQDDEEMSYKISSILPKNNNGSMQKYLEFVVSRKSLTE